MQLSNNTLSLKIAFKFQSSHAIRFLLLESKMSLNCRNSLQWRSPYYVGILSYISPKLSRQSSGRNRPIEIGIMESRKINCNLPQFPYPKETRSNNCQSMAQVLPPNVDHDFHDYREAPQHHRSDQLVRNNACVCSLHLEESEDYEFKYASKEDHSKDNDYSR